MRVDRRSIQVRHGSGTGVGRGGCAQVLNDGTLYAQDLSTAVRWLLATRHRHDIRERTGTPVRQSACCVYEKNLAGPVALRPPAPILLACFGDRKFLIRHGAYRALLAVIPVSSD